MLGEDESRHGIISAPVDCRVDGLFMTHEGQAVTQRQPIATIFSPALLTAAAKYKEALATSDPALGDVRAALLQMGLVHEQIDSIPERQQDDVLFGMLSPRSGTIVKAFVTEGQHLRAGQKMFETADFTRLWFHAMIPAQDAPFLKLGQIVRLQSDTLPGETLTARLSNISPLLDQMTGQARIRVVIENPERRIKTNLFVQGEILVETGETLCIPRSAVIWPGGTPRVYVQKPSDVYESRPIRLGRSGDYQWEVLDGLMPGEHVVTSGAMLIDGQAQLLRQSP